MGFNPCFNGTMYKNYTFIGSDNRQSFGFNPCFNGTMYKNHRKYRVSMSVCVASFNPCFNGTMYKNIMIHACACVHVSSFNPCFNGTMYKN